ncbi:Hpt domain-containing protein [Nitrosophilus labii]|uniref:Hpt domain-containing protein n=1 Tax=Nitrosophilus labii TaxID=2706014 RepID=UPI001657071F|nr:Hpt domain-containing protein [Nitrosophilus labii]
MILYGSNKQMLAISQELLDFLGFESIDELKEKIDDIANLFVNKPGYIYNFKNFSWIDYIVFNQVKKPRAILNLDDNEIEVELQVSILASIDKDSSYYLVSISPLSSLSSDTVSDRYLEIENMPKVMENKDENPTITEENFLEDLIDQKPSHIHITDKSEQSEDMDTTKIFDKENLYNDNSSDEQALNINFDDIIHKEEPLSELEKTKSSEQSTYDNDEYFNLYFDKENEVENIITDSKIEKSDSDKIYDLHKVSNELGLDESLIKELLDEFISQAYEQKPKIEKAFEDKDSETIHSLVHKIKGAAANLRIEKANEILASTTGENDLEKLKEILKNFYDFIEIFKEHIYQDGSGSAPEKEEDTLPESHIETEERQTKDFNEQKIDSDNDLPSIKENPKEETAKDILFTPYEPKTASKELGIPENVIIEFVKEYIKQNKEHIKKLFKLLENRDIKGIKNICHKLKGSAANLRINNIVELLDKILYTTDYEDFEKTKKYIQQCFEYLEYLENEYGSIDNKLDNLDNIVKDTNEKIGDISKEQIKKVAAEIGLEVDVYNIFLKEFLETIQTVLDKNDKEELKKEAKKLKSMADNLRLEELAKLLSKIETDDYHEKELENLINTIKNFEYNI